MNTLHAPAWAVAKKLSELGCAAMRVDQFCVGHAALNTMCKADVNTACIQNQPAGRTLPRVHPSAKQLLDLAKSATYGTAAPITTFGGLVARLGVSSATMTNWKARGVSKEGAIQAEALFGGSASALLRGEPPQQVRSEDAENLARLCDSITDWAERERFIVVTEHYAKLAIRGRLGAVLDGIYLAAPASGTTTAPVLNHAPQTDADPATQSGRPGVAR